MPDDWYKSNYTVEPTVGTADDTNPYVRYVSATSVESANVTYRSMISADVTDGAVTDDEWSMDGIGTLDFKVLDQPDVIATVDVKVKQLPHLTQIRFVPPSAMGENSNWFSGDPYYNFGDIVQDKEGSYWICVRPADKATKKSKTHWISFNIVKDNFEEYENGDATLVLPDKLGDKAGSEEFIPDFLQFLKAISPGLIVKNDNKGRPYRE